jgi:hypothetical protein
MKTVILLVATAIELEHYAKQLEIGGEDIVLVIHNIERSKLWLGKLQEDFADAAEVPFVDLKSFDDANIIDLEMGIVALKQDIKDHIASLLEMNKSYERIINNALSAIEESELFLDAYVGSVSERNTKDEDRNEHLTGSGLDTSAEHLNRQNTAEETPEEEKASSDGSEADASEPTAKTEVLEPLATNAAVSEASGSAEDAGQATTTEEKAATSEEKTTETKVIPPKATTKKAK